MTETTGTEFCLTFSPDFDRDDPSLLFHALQSSAARQGLYIRVCNSLRLPSFTYVLKASFEDSAKGAPDLENTLRMIAGPSTAVASNHDAKNLTLTLSKA